MFDRHKDWRQATSERQLLNHWKHAAAATGIFWSYHYFLLRFSGPLHPAVFWLLVLMTVVAVACSKELSEHLKRTWLSETPRFWDVIFDLVGWIVPALAWLIFKGAPSWP